jgi:C_GCAxxG_C_C family probable redox protein
MTKPDVALCLFRQGFSCSQAIAAAFAEGLGLDKDAALRLSQPFGGGIARRADWCGAMTGDAAARERTYALVGEFIDRFTARHGHFRCKDLLGCDIGTPEGRKIADERKLHQTRCEDFVRDAAVILEEIL